MASQRREQGAHGAAISFSVACLQEAKEEEKK